MKSGKWKGGFDFLKKHKKAVICILLAFILAGAVLGPAAGGKKEPIEEPDSGQSTTVIERKDLLKSISVTGTIATEKGKSGSTTLTNIKVESVNVEVGDEVQEGDIICTFDSSDIQEALTVAQNNYSLNKQIDKVGPDYETQYKDSIKQAEDTLNDVRDKRDEAKSARDSAAEQENAAKTAAENAAADLETKMAAYETVKAEVKTAADAYEKAKGNDTMISDLDAYLQNMDKNPDFAEKKENAEEDGDIENDETEKETDEAKKAAYTALLEKAESYQSVKSAYEAAEAAAGQTQSAYEQAKAAASETQSAYEQAKSAREDAQEVYENSLENAQTTYEKAKLQSQLITDQDAKKQIDQYEEQLSDCTVKASMSGVVTSLSVEEGQTFTGGKLYEIQDLNHFIVEASVDEYDIVNIKKGMTAYVKTDSLGEEQLTGKVTYVAPTATTAATSDTAGAGTQTGTSGTVSYQVQITIEGEQDKLRPGMTAKVSIAEEESKGVLAVPYDCIETNEKGESILYVDENGEKKAVTVTKGIETDYYTEVSGEGLKEGMTVYLSQPMALEAPENMDDPDSGMGGGPGGPGGRRGF